MTRRWVAGLAVGALLAGSAIAVATAPDNDAVVAPFLIAGRIGEPMSGRVLTVTVNSVELADVLQVRYRDVPDLETSGVWVVVDATVTARLDTEVLSNSELDIGGVRYRVSDALPAPTPLQLSYGADVPQRSTLVFEIPRSALEAAGASRASVVFLHRTDAQLDSVPVVVVDLASLDIQRSARIDEVWVIDQ